MPIVGDFSGQSPLRGLYEEFLPDQIPQWGLTEVYQENPRQRRDLPGTRTLVQSLSNIQCRGVFWFLPLCRWRLTIDARAMLPDADYQCSQVAMVETLYA